MTEARSTKTSLKVPTISEEEHFHAWQVKMITFLDIQGVAHCVERLDPDLPSSNDEELDVSTDEGKKAFKARQDNQLAVAYLFQAAADQNDLFTMLEAATENWPRGIAYHSMAKLCKKYEPNDMLTKVERAKKIEELKMGQNEDPEKLFTALNTLNSNYASRLKALTDEEMLAVIMRKLPAKYSTVLATESIRLGFAFNVAAARNAVRIMYRAGMQDEAGTSEEEVALNATYKCYDCGKPGHKASDCPQRREQDASKGNGSGNQNNARGGNYGRRGGFQGNCFQCGKKGHRKADCYQNTIN